MLSAMSPKPAKQKAKKATDIASDSEGLEEGSQVAYGVENSSPSYGDKASGFHADTSDIFQAIHSVRVDMASQFESVLSAVQDVKNQFAECFGRLAQTEDTYYTSIDNQRS